MKERAETAEGELDALRNEYERLQRTVKFMEETYLKEHGGSWGKCQYQSKVESAEARAAQLETALRGGIEICKENASVTGPFSKWRELKTLLEAALAAPVAQESTE